jgi:hypothetical protein
MREGRARKISLERQLTLLRDCHTCRKGRKVIHEDDRHMCALLRIVVMKMDGLLPTR